ncbi:MAG TPA: hypothetical protein VH253_10920 [Phycisphaerae bacterium]|nr:hypothetical protein [Phycisphaerae bacterium]
MTRLPAGGFRVDVRGFGAATFAPADLTDPAARESFVRAIGERFPDLAFDGAPDALARCIRELASGQPAAGDAVDAIRASVRCLAEQLAAEPEPKRKKNPSKAERIRRMNLQLSEVPA